MRRPFLAVALLATVAVAPLSANAQPVPSCPPGTFTPVCAREPHGGGNDLHPPSQSDVDPKGRSDHAGTIGHGAAHVGGSHGGGAGSHGGGAGGHGGGGGGGGAAEGVAAEGATSQPVAPITFNSSARCSAGSPPADQPATSAAFRPAPDAATPRDCPRPRRAMPPSPPVPGSAQVDSKICENPL